MLRVGRRHAKNSLHGADRLQAGILGRIAAKLDDDGVFQHPGLSAITIEPRREDPGSRLTCRVSVNFALVSQLGTELRLSSGSLSAGEALSAPRALRCQKTPKDRLMCRVAITDVGEGIRSTLRPKYSSPPMSPPSKSPSLIPLAHGSRVLFAVSKRSSQTKFAPSFQLHGSHNQ